MRSQDSQRAVALRAALDSPWPELQSAARNVIRTALKSGTIKEGADLLGISRRTLERIRTEFPDAFGAGDLRRSDVTLGPVRRKKKKDGA